MYIQSDNSMLRQIFLTGLLMIATTFAASAAETELKTPVASPGRETITLGGGCFWCLQAVFTDLTGVTPVASGYDGGRVQHPSTEQSSRANPGHD